MQSLNNLFNALSADGAFYRKGNRRDGQVARSQISVTKRSLAALVKHQPGPGPLPKMLI